MVEFVKPCAFLAIGRTKYAILGVSTQFHRSPQLRITAAELKVSAEKGLCVYIVPDTSAERADNFNAIAKNFVPTRERIRQIEAKALRKLKHPSRSRQLRSFLDT